LPAGKLTQGELMSPDFKDARNYVLHAGFTHQFGTRDALSFDYTHIIGLNGMRARDINPVEGAWDPKDCTVPVTGPLPNTEYLYSPCPAANQIVPYGTRRLAPRFGAVLGDPKIMSVINVQEASNRMRYDELIVHWEHRARRASFQATYTLAQANAFGGVFTSGYGGALPTSVNTDLAFGPGEWGPTPIDERHRIVISGVFDLGWGIQVAPILQAASARPYNLVTGSDSNGDGQGLFAYSRDQYIDPATGTPVGINSQRGEPTFNLDARVTKFINIKGERNKLGLFLEFYNLTNRANFGAVFNGNAAAGAAFRTPSGFTPGLPTARQMQWGVRY
jgi:hypothetical protein